MTAHKNAARSPISYLMTHFPAVSHTFVADEISALEASGVPVATFAINPPRNVDAKATDATEWSQRTTYLKRRPLGTIWLTMKALVWHPSLLGLVVRPGGWDAKAYVWRIFHLAEGAALAEQMRRIGSQHVHAHFGQSPATIAWFAAEVANSCRRPDDPQVTWSVTIHGWHEFTNEEHAGLRAKVASAAFVACISDFTRSQLCRISSPRDWSKLHVIRCGIDLDRFTRRPHPPDNDRPRVLVVARVSPEKGHLVLVDAMHELAARHDFDLDILGPDADGFSDVVMARAAELGLADRVHMCGAATHGEVARALDGADVFCLPTFAEGLPVVIMEAMARGVPVVTTYIAGIPELAIHNDTALLAPASNATALAEGIERLLTDPVLRDRLTDSAAQRVRQDHDVRRNVEHLAHLFADRSMMNPS